MPVPWNRSLGAKIPNNVPNVCMKFPSANRPTICVNEYITDASGHLLCLLVCGIVPCSRSELQEACHLGEFSLTINTQSLIRSCWRYAQRGTLYSTAVFIPQQYEQSVMNVRFNISSRPDCAHPGCHDKLENAGCSNICFRYQVYKRGFPGFGENLA